VTLLMLVVILTTFAGGDSTGRHVILADDDIEAKPTKRRLLMQTHRSKEKWCNVSHQCAIVGTILMYRLAAICC
jgi:hypothetical protein